MPSHALLSAFLLLICVLGFSLGEQLSVSHRSARMLHKGHCDLSDAGHTLPASKESSTGKPFLVRQEILQKASYTPSRHAGVRVRLAEGNDTMSSVMNCTSQLSKGYTLPLQMSFSLPDDYDTSTVLSKVAFDATLRFGCYMYVSLDGCVRQQWPHEVF